METICLVLRGVGSLLKQDKVVRGKKKVTSNCMLDKIVLTLSAGGVHSENLLPEVPRRKGRNLEKKRNLKEEKKMLPFESDQWGRRYFLYLFCLVIERWWDKATSLFD